MNILLRAKQIEMQESLKNHLKALIQLFKIKII